MLSQEDGIPEKDVQGSFRLAGLGPPRSAVADPQEAEAAVRVLHQIAEMEAGLEIVFNAGERLPL